MDIFKPTTSLHLSLNPPLVSIHMKTKDGWRLVVGLKMDMKTSGGVKED